MPRFPKPPDRRQGHRARVMPRAELTDIVRVPDVPDGLLRVTREAWDEYWQSDMARMTRSTHWPMVRRLFVRYDERERSYRALRKNGRCVMGSKGQPVLSPLIKYIDSCDAEIRQLEDRLGLSPRGMAQLGAHFAHAQKSLDDLNRGDQGAPDDYDAPDPRLEIAE